MYEFNFDVMNVLQFLAGLGGGVGGVVKYYRKNRETLHPIPEQPILPEERYIFNQRKMLKDYKQDLENRIYNHRIP